MAKVLLNFDSQLRSLFSSMSLAVQGFLLEFWLLEFCSTLLMISKRMGSIRLMWHLRL